jgi:uncharacterized protein YjiS (DUF1127 family)
MMIVTSLTATRAHASSEILDRVVWRGMGGGLALIAVWHERFCARRDLARMSDHLLKDIGLTPGDAADEIAKPFWRG